jgi:hypothetical protein
MDFAHGIDEGATTRVAAEEDRVSSGNTIEIDAS